eukprot:29494-Pelagococcus_subviridis.AAC.4
MTRFIASKNAGHAATCPATPSNTLSRPPRSPGIASACPSARSTAADARGILATSTPPPPHTTAFAANVSANAVVSSSIHATITSRVASDM